MPCGIFSTARSGSFFPKHARGASGILKTRRRPSNFSAAGCRTAEKYTRSRCALVEFSPSTPARLQVFSSRAVGPTTFLRLAAEQLKNTRAPDVLWSNFRQARPRRFRYSQDAQSAWQLFCDWLPSCCKIHTLSTTFTACSVSVSACVLADMASCPVAASPGPVARSQQRRQPLLG